MKKVLFLLAFLLLIPLGAKLQGGPDDNSDYTTIFDENDLYISSTQRKYGVIQDDAINLNGNSFLNLGSLLQNPKNNHSQDQTMGAPPPTPDVPINEFVYLLIILGIIYGCVKILR